MRVRSSLLGTLTAVLVTVVAVSDALAKSNPRRGNVYYNQVCNACHKQAGADLQPDSRTIEEWAAYFAVDLHNAGVDQQSVKHFLSESYRASIATENKAAKKFEKLSEEQLFQDVRAYLLNNASDSDVANPCL